MLAQQKAYTARICAYVHIDINYVLSKCICYKKCLAFNASAVPLLNLFDNEQYRFIRGRIPLPIVSLG